MGVTNSSRMRNAADDPFSTRDVENGDHGVPYSAIFLQLKRPPIHVPLQQHFEHENSVPLLQQNVSVAGLQLVPDPHEGRGQRLLADVIKKAHVVIEDRRRWREIVVEDMSASHQRRFVGPAVRQNVRGTLGRLMLVLELLLEGHQPLAKRFPRPKSLNLFAPVRVYDSGHILSGVVVKARFEAERRAVASVKPNHSVFRHQS
jgi:hypothetical protein